MTTREEIEKLIPRLRTLPTVVLPDMGSLTVDVATSIRQLMVERAEAADALQQLLGEARLGAGEIGLQTTAEEREHIRSTASEHSLMHWPFLLRLFNDFDRLLSSRAQERTWQPIASAPKTDRKVMKAIPFIGLCKNEFEPTEPTLTIRVVWWEPLMNGNRGLWYGDRDMEENPVAWMPLPPPPVAENREGG